MIADTSDTICAISTPAGTGGIAVIRVSGPDAFSAVGRIWRGTPIEKMDDHTAHLGNIIDPLDNGNVIDQGMALVMHGPRSYTGENTVELSVHGSVWLQHRIITLLTMPNGRVRLAEPGEFTKRAFISGHLDLARAEAVADMIASRSQAAHRIAVNQLRGGLSRMLDNLRSRLLELTTLLEIELDFSEEDIEFASRDHLSALTREIYDTLTRLHSSYSAGEALLHGIPVAIVGPTNAGKSSLLNALVGDDRAIVSDTHGTTRDVIQDTMTIDGYQFRLMDTAGLREHPGDPVESAGIERSIDTARRAAIVIIVSPLDQNVDYASLTAGIPMPSDPRQTILLLNKCDLPHQTLQSPPSSRIGHMIETSTLTGTGLDKLSEILLGEARRMSGAEDDIIITNRRHAIILNDALQALNRVKTSLATPAVTADIIAEDLRLVLHHIGTITGAITTPEILSTVFSHFCVGK